MLNPAVTHRFTAGLSGSSGHSVARIPMKPAMVVSAAMVAEISKLHPILSPWACALSPMATGHSRVPAVIKTPTAAANPTTPAASKPHFTSLSVRPWFFRFSRLRLKKALLFKIVFAIGPKAGNLLIKTSFTSSTLAARRGLRSRSRMPRRLESPRTISRASASISKSKPLDLLGYGGHTAWAVACPAVK